MTRVTCLVLAAALVPGSAAGAVGGGDTDLARPPLGLTAAPAHVSLDGTGSASIRISNPGNGPVSVDLARAGFALDRGGAPKIVAHGARRAATSWLTLRPARFVLPAGATRAVALSARVPAGAEPGDHDALVLVTTRPVRRAAVALRMRIGVVVVVRAPGRVVRRLTIGPLQAHRAHGPRVLELTVVNRGNVTETLSRGRLRLVLRRGRRQTTLFFEPRDLRPGTRGVAQIRYRGPLHGWVTARVRLRAVSGDAAVTRAYRVRL
jgi:hypothetical protein